MKRKIKLTLLAGLLCFLLPIFGYLSFLWMASGFSSHFMEIDVCLDRGGCWDRVDNVCRQDEPDAQALCDRGKDLRQVAYAGSRGLAKEDVLTWPHANAQEFGCFLEKAFGHKDGKFNCELKDYVNAGDPCKNTDAYYEGPAFPAGKAKAVNALFDDIQLSWEHGELQGVNVTLREKLDEMEVRRRLGLPEKEGYRRPNVMSLSIQQCSLNATCLVIQGFDHMGAGDVNCGGEE